MGTWQLRQPVEWKPLCDNGHDEDEMRRPESELRMSLCSDAFQLLFYAGAP
jgi:hypothetical protein